MPVPEDAAQEGTEEMPDKKKTPAPKVKAKAKRPAKSAKAPKPRKESLGGLGARLIPERANVNEAKILKALADAGKPMTIEDIAGDAYPGKKASGDAEDGKPVSPYRKVVNGMRRLRVRGLVKLEPKVLGADKKEGLKGRKRSTYTITAAGRKFASEIA